MSVQSHSKPKETEEQDRPPAVRLEESLRDLVQEEMGIARGAAQKQIPSRTDAFWLFLCVADAALLLWLLPDAMLSNKRVELLGKLLTWLGGSLFIFGYVWFRDLFLSYVRHRSFKIMLVALPFFLIPFYVTQMNIFSITPVIEPRTAELEIDELPRQKDNLKFSLRFHKVIVRENGRDDKPEVNQREFPFKAVDVWHYWWYEKKPYWPLLFKVPVDFNLEGPQEIELVKEDGRLDPEFRGAKPQLTYQREDGEIASHLGNWREDGSILFTWPYKPGTLGSIGLTLPYGRYRLTASFADKKGCDKSALKFIMAKPGVESDDISVERKCT